MAWLQASPCRFLINKNFHRYWLPCAIQQGPVAQGRRLLQQAQSPQLQEHSQPAFMSNTMVSYGVSSSSSSSNTALNTSGAGKAGNNDGGVALVILVSGVVGGVLVAILMVLVIYFACLRRAGGSRPLRDIKMA